MEFLNLIPIAALVYFVFVAIKGASPRDYMDKYFQREKSNPGRKFRNLFGVPQNLHNLNNL